MIVPFHHGEDASEREEIERILAMELTNISDDEEENKT